MEIHFKSEILLPKNDVLNEFQIVGAVKEVSAEFQQVHQVSETGRLI